MNAIVAVDIRSCARWMKTSAPPAAGPLPLFGGGAVQLATRLAQLFSFVEQRGLVTLAASLRFDPDAPIEHLVV